MRPTGWKVRPRLVGIIDSIIFAAIPGIALHVVLREYDAPFWTEVLVPVAFGASLVALVEQASPGAHAFLLARRGAVVTAVAIIVGLLGAVLDGSGILGPTYRASNVLAYVRCSLDGAIVGALMRMAIGTFFYRGLTGRPMRQVRRLLFLAFAIAAALTPTPPRPAWSMFVYLTGIGGGFVFHFGIRTRIRRGARRANRTVDLLRYVEAPRGLKDFEAAAIRCFAREDFPALREILARPEAAGNTRLVIIRACMFLIEGRYADALMAVGNHLDTTFDPGLESKLRALKAVCYGELDEHAAMWTSLEEALQANEYCVLSNLTYALRKAEQVPIHPSERSAANEAVKHIEEALKHIRRALALTSTRDRKSLNLEEDLIGSSIPITWSTFVDAYAYVLLKSGDIRLSRTLFPTCIRDDPDFPAAYLHLGEWHLRRRQEASDDGDDVLASEAGRLAKVCLKLAAELDRNDKGVDSFTRRRALALLGNIEGRSRTRSNLDRSHPGSPQSPTAMN